jgi:GrpB-like predicted nucleotidyltransferase (UPF0157 family)
MTPPSPPSGEPGITPRTSRIEREALLESREHDGYDAEAAAETMARSVAPPKDVHSTRIVLVPFNPDWRNRFLVIGQRLRKALGPAALRIDHIGSTSVPGLLAKPIIDVQVSVPSLEVVDADFVAAAEGLGLTYWADNPDRTKRFFTGDFRGVNISNVHVRAAGTFNEQFQLLFRDFLRADQSSRERYADEKEKLAGHSWITVDDYAEAKGDVIWATLRDALRWSFETAWAPPPSDVD